MPMITNYLNLQQMKSNSILIVDIFHHVKDVGEYFHFLFTEEIQLLNNYFVICLVNSQCTSRMMMMILMKSWQNQHLRSQCLQPGWSSTKKYSDARNLAYPQFVSKYVYNKNQRCWKPRQSFDYYHKCSFQRSF